MSNWEMKKIGSIRVKLQVEKSKISTNCLRRFSPVQWRWMSGPLSFGRIIIEVARARVTLKQNELKQEEKIS